MIEDGRLLVLSNKTLNKIDVALVGKDVDMGTKDYLKSRRTIRTFILLKMTYTPNFHQFRDKGEISPIGPLKDQPTGKRNLIWDKDSYCEYHSGKGHHTKRCKGLQGIIQDMIDDKRLQLLSNPNYLVAYIH